MPKANNQHLTNCLNRIRSLRPAVYEGNSSCRYLVHFLCSYFTKKKLVYKGIEKYLAYFPMTFPKTLTSKPYIMVNYAKILQQTFSVRCPISLKIDSKPLSF